MKLLILNGPNLNLLGLREPEIYGNKTYSDLVCLIKDYCSKKGIYVEIKQTNHEGEMLDIMQDAYNRGDISREQYKNAMNSVNPSTGKYNAPISTTNTGVDTPVNNGNANSNTTDNNVKPDANASKTKPDSTKSVPNGEYYQDGAKATSENGKTNFAFSQHVQYDEDGNVIKGSQTADGK